MAFVSTGCVFLKKTDSASMARLGVLGPADPQYANRPCSESPDPHAARVSQDVPVLWLSRTNVAQS